MCYYVRTSSINERSPELPAASVAGKKDFAGTEAMQQEYGG